MLHGIHALIQSCNHNPYLQCIEYVNIKEIDIIDPYIHYVLNTSFIIAHSLLFKQYVAT